MFNSWEGQQHAHLALQYKFIINNKTQLDLRLFVVRIGGPDVIDETKDRTVTKESKIQHKIVLDIE